MARRMLILGALAGSVATALISGIAWAAIPSADGTIRACYDGGGTLRVIDEGSSCAKGWKGPIAWNQAGIPGEDGTQLTMQSVYEVESELEFDDGTQILRVADCRPGDIALGADSVTFFRAGDGNWTVGIYTPDGADFERVQFHAVSGNNPVIIASARCLDITP